MLDRRTAIGKVIDDTKCIYHCLRCGRDMVGDIHTDTHYCPRCKTQEDTILLVIIGNMLVRK